MANDRASIFARLKKALEASPDRAAYPDYEDEVATAEPRLSKEALWDDFARNFQAVNGRPMTAIEEVIAFLKKEDATVGYCDPALKATLGEACTRAGFTVHYHYERDRYDDYQFGITRASGIIAETGTVILTDGDTSDRLAALTPWIHVAFLSPGRQFRSVAQAIKGFGNEGNIIWATGPSKTADIEGILIEGVHGPGEQICLKLDA